VRCGRHRSRSGAERVPAPAPTQLAVPLGCRRPLAS
jgi:hypothetical protein